jgi:hypothetical protein
VSDYIRGSKPYIRGGGVTGSNTHLCRRRQSFLVRLQDISSRGGVRCRVGRSYITGKGGLELLGLVALGACWQAFGRLLYIGQHFGTYACLLSMPAIGATIIGQN